MSGYQGNQMNTGNNPPNGITIPYFVKQKNDSLIYRISFYDKSNHVIKAFSTKPKKKEEQLTVENGYNTLTWDMRYEGGEKIEGMILWNGVPSGPRMAPGIYKAMIQAGNDSQVVSYEVKPDPNYNVSIDAIEAQTAFLLQVIDKFNDVQKGIRKIREVRNQLNAVQTKLGEDCPKALKDTATYIIKKMSVIENELYQTKAKAAQDVLNYPVKLNDKLAAVYNAASAGVAAPSAQARQVFSELSAQADRNLKSLQAIIDSDLKVFNQIAKDKDIPVILLNKD